MGVITTAALAIRKAASSVVPFPGFGGQSWYGGSGWAWPMRQIGERDYRLSVGNGEDSSIVAACVNWVANQATQAMPAVRRYTKSDTLGSYVRDHPAAQLARHPTFDIATGQSFYPWEALIKATITALVVDGNAYWLKVRSKSGRVVQLWFVPSWMMIPRWPLDGTTYISHYDYVPSASTERLPLQPTEVVHFRDGIDPNNTRLGVSALKTLLREIFTDEEAARWTASLLKNQGVPGIVVSPGVGGGIPGAEDVKEIKARFMADFTGDHRGEPIVMSGPTTVEQYGFNPTEMNLGDLRDVPEERISAVIGVPAAVAGLGTGLKTAKVGATMGELVDLGWMNGVIPRHKIIAGTTTEQLLPDFDMGFDDVFEFDTTRVPIMATYHKAQAEIHQQNYRWGIEQRGEARRSLALPSGPEDEIYVLQSGASTIDPDGDVISGKDTALANEPLSGPTDALPAVTLVPAAPAPAIAPAAAPLALGPGKALTRREGQILEHLAKGLSNRAIADELVIAERTVERHVAAILAKRGVTSRLALVGIDAKAAAAATTDDVGDKLDELADLLRDRDTSQQVDVLREMEKAAVRRDEALLAGLREIAGRNLVVTLPAPGPTERIITERDAQGRASRSIERPLAAAGGKS